MHAAQSFPSQELNHKQHESSNRSKMKNASLAEIIAVICEAILSKAAKKYNSLPSARMLPRVRDVPFQGLPFITTVPSELGVRAGAALMASLQSNGLINTSEFILKSYDTF